MNRSPIAFLSFAGRLDASAPPERGPRHPVAFFAFRDDRLLVAAGIDAPRLGASLTKGGMHRRLTDPRE